MQVKRFIRQNRWIAGCAVFLLIFAVAFIHISYMLRPTTEDRTIIPGYVSQPKNTIDMLYVGGSACFMFWMPVMAYEKYGIASYNFGTSGINPNTLKSTLMEALKTQSPSLILIDARPFQYGNAESITEVDLRNLTDSIRYSKERFQYIRQLVPSKIKPGDSADPWCYIFDIVKYHNRWPDLNEQSWRLADAVNQNKQMGFQFFKWLDPSLQEIGCSQITAEMEISPGLNQILADLLDYCSKLDAEILFVTNSYVELPEDRMKYNYIKQEISQYSNISYINTNDYNEQIGLDYGFDFGDKSHVNAFGAEKYTTFLGQYIKEHYALADRRQDGRYNDWDKMIPVFAQTLQEEKEYLIGLLN